MKRISPRLYETLLPIFFLVSSLCLYYGFYCLAGIITNQMKTLLQMLPLVIISNIPFFIFRYIYSAFFQKRKTVRSFYIFFSVLLALLLGCILVSIQYRHFYYENFQNHRFLTVYFLFLVLSLIFFSIMVLIRKEELFAINEWPRKSECFMTQTHNSFHLFWLWACIYSAMYLLGAGLFAIFRFVNFTVAPLTYPVIIFYLIVPSVTSSFVLFSAKGSKAATRLFFDLNCLSAVLGVLFFFNFSEDIVCVGQNLFFNSFSTSYPIGQVLTFIMQAGMLFYLGRKAYSKKELKKA